MRNIFQWLPGLQMFPRSLFESLQTCSSWLRLFPHLCSGLPEDPSVPGSLPPFQAWSWLWFLPAPHPDSGPCSWLVSQAWSGPGWPLSLSGIHVWGSSLPGVQASVPRSLLELQVCSSGCGCSRLASDPSGQTSFPISLGGMFTDLSSEPLARPPDDITEQLVVV